MRAQIPARGTSEQPLTRRGFVRAFGAGVALHALRQRISPAVSSSRPGETPLFRFIQWNDIHADESQPPGYKLANEKMKYLVEWANDQSHLPRCDFVIGVGDIIHGGSLQDLPLDLGVARKLLGHLKSPFYPVMGNHENVQEEGDAQHEAPFRETFGNDRTNYTLKHKGLLFIMLNNSGAPSANAKDAGRRRNEWFRRVLMSSPDIPKIVCCHIPLIPLRDEPVLGRSFGFASYAARDEQLVGLVDEHAASIIAVLSGHLHLTGVSVRHGVHHVCISGTASYPCDFATYDVFPDRVQLRMHSLPESLVTPATDIHGRRRHGVDYTDLLHPTHQAYVMGTPSERNVTMEIVRASPPVQERRNNG